MPKIITNCPSTDINFDTDLDCDVIDSDLTDQQAIINNVLFNLKLLLKKLID